MRTFAVGLLTAAAFSTLLPASGAAQVYVGVRPPAPIVEPVPVAPGPNYVWHRGFHRWDGNRYVWVPGSYVVRPRPRAVWVEGRWVNSPRGYYWRDGYWR